MLVVVMVITYVHLSHGSQKHHPITKRNIVLTLENITCIREEFARSNPTTSCTTVEAGIEALYNVVDLTAAIASRLDLFDNFCQPSCGQAIINAWEACGVYNDVINEAQLLINLCSANNGRSCYRDFVNIVNLYSRGYGCSTQQACSEDCRTAVTSGVQSYGCCLNIPITYNDAVFPDDRINAGANEVFASCSVSRPAACPASPLGGAGHLVAAVTLLVLSSIISILMSL